VTMEARAVIFDFDGLIMDTETATFEAWREIYQRHGQSLTMETWAQCVGSDFGDYDPKRELENLTGCEFDWDTINTERRTRVMAILSEYDALPGVRERLQEADDLNLPRAVASSSPRWWVEHWLKHLGLLEAFQNVTCLEDTGKVKPHPSLFQHAALKLGAKPDDVIVLEDSLNGLRAAQLAEMRCVVVPCAVTQHLDFEGAWRQHGSLNEFQFRHFTVR
jgi:putative hydrolase of the HAD superfamily